MIALASSTAPSTEPTIVAPQRHAIDAGTLLLWHETASLSLATVPEVATAAALVAYSLPTDPREEGAMLLLTPRTAVCPSTTPQIALLLSEPTLRRLLADAPPPAGALLLSVLDFPDTPPAILPLPAPARFAGDAIRRCPLRGLCRELALTARAHDLLLAFLGAVPTPLDATVPPLLRGVVEQLRAAAAIIDRDLENPPSLHELAVRVGLSETALKRGFPRVFDQTVFGYLRERRLERAKTLIETGECTVLEAAARVGYSNPSNFAAAFRARFGVNPKTFQLAVRV